MPVDTADDDPRHVAAPGERTVTTIGRGGADTLSGHVIDCAGDSRAVACFAAGTMIMTATGERAVETLRAGDMLVTTLGFGAPLKPMRRLGHCEIDLDTDPGADDLAPILVLPGAMGAGVPHRPLRVSPDHVLLVEGALIPARLLVNGETICRMPARGRITYFHVQFDAYELILAEGAQTESHVDPGKSEGLETAGVVQNLRRLPRVTEGAPLDKARLAIARHCEGSGQDPHGG